MGKYLDIIDRAEAACDKSDKSDKSQLVPIKSKEPLRQKSPTPCDQRSGDKSDKSTIGRFGRTFRELEALCPDRIDAEDWRRAVEDGKRFLATWGDQAERLGWTSRELFGLHTVPENPRPNYQRLSRYDETGLIWLLEGRPVIALTADTAAIQCPSGAVVTYGKSRKPAQGPIGDSLDDFASNDEA